MSLKLISKVIGLFILVLAVVVIVWVSRPSRVLPERPDAVMMIDITTGDVFRVRLNDGVILPVRNPRTGEATLLPLSNGPSGIQQRSDNEGSAARETGRFVSRRYLENTGLDREAIAKIVDIESGRVLVEVTEPVDTIN